MASKFNVVVRSVDFANIITTTVVEGVNSKGWGENHSGQLFIYRSSGALALILPAELLVSATLVENTDGK